VEETRVAVVPGKGMRLRRVTAADAGVYMCKATNPVGAAYAKAELFVQEPPDIDLPPRSEKSTQYQISHANFRPRIVVELGSSVRLPCRTSGRPRPLVLWLDERDRTFLAVGESDSSGNIRVDDEGDLRIASLVTGNDFTCLASNSVGSASAKTKIRIKGEEIPHFPGEKTVGEKAKDPFINKRSYQNCRTLYRARPLQSLVIGQSRRPSPTGGRSQNHRGRRGVSDVFQSIVDTRRSPRHSSKAMKVKSVLTHFRLCSWWTAFTFSTVWHRRAPTPRRSARTSARASPQSQSCMRPPPPTPSTTCSLSRNTT